MPDVFKGKILAIVKSARMVEVTQVTTVVTTIADDGGRVVQPARVTQTERWCVIALVDEEWIGKKNKEFYYPTESAAAVIRPGYEYTI